MLENFGCKFCRGMSIGFDGLEADRNRLVIGLEDLRECFFSSERWLAREEEVVVDVWDRDRWGY